MKKEIIEKLSALITAATGFIVALAWNSAIKEIFERFFAEGLIPMLIYAVLVTIIAIILTIWIGRIAAKDSQEEDTK